MKNSPFGFSLVELIVVISIVVIFTTILIVYNRSSDNQIIFFNSESLVFNSLLRVKTLAIETFQPTQAAPGIPNEVICGWGVHFEDRSSDEDSFTIFKDLDVSGSKTPCETSGSGYGVYNNSSSGESFESFEIDPAVEIICVYLSGGECSTSAGNLDLMFVPPDPRVYFAHDLEADEAVIVLGLSDKSRCSEIRITASGQVNRSETLPCSNY